MKKNILFGAVALMALGSCSQDEAVMQTSSADGISYSVSARKHTRAADSYDSNNLPAYFNVYAQTSSDGSLYIDGDKVVKGADGTWTDESGTRYWPIGGDLDFFAHVNGGNSFSLNSGNPTFNAFAVNDAVASQTDLMYAVTPQSKSMETVQLNFRHALSQICFRAKNSSKTMSMTIKGVSIGHLAGTATYTLPTTATSGDDKAAGSWSNYGEYTKQYDVAFDGVTIAANGGEANLTEPTDENNNDFSNVLALLPQTVNAWTTAAGNTTYDGAYFLIDAELDNVAGETSTTVYSGKIAIPVNIAWTQGCRYTYTFVLGEGSNGGWTADPSNPQPLLATINYEVAVDNYQTANNTSNMEATVVYALTYNANGGTFSNNETTKQVSVEAAGAITIDDDAPTYEKHAFLGWSEEADATEATYTAGSTVNLTKEAPSKTLYAVWQKDASETVTLNPTADTWIRSGQSNDKYDATRDASSLMEVKTYKTTSDNETTTETYFYSIMSFAIPAEAVDGNHTITSAKLYLVTDRAKGGKNMAVYSSDTYPDQPKYSDFSTLISGIQGGTATSVATFTAKTAVNNSLMTDIAKISASNLSLASWTNEIDLTSYISKLSTGTAKANFLIATSDNSNGQTCFVTSDATDFTGTSSDSQSISFAAKDLKPRLVITYTEN